MNYKIFILGTPRSGTTLVNSSLVKYQDFRGGIYFKSQFYATFCNLGYKKEYYLKNNYFSDLLEKGELKEIFINSINYVNFLNNAIDFYLKKEKEKFLVKKS